MLCVFMWSNALSNVITNNIPGMDQSNSNRMIELAALVGLLPLEYYIYLPIQFDKYINENKYVEEIVMLQESLFTKEYTPNIHQKVLSKIHNNVSINNTFYYFPWYQKKVKKLTKYNMQLCFRIQGLCCNNKLSLEAFDRRNNHTFISA